MAVVLQLGLTDYTAAHALQEALLERRITGDIPDVLLLLQHPTTITVGRAQQALANVLQAEDIPVVSIKRGGDVTLHAPGQLVAYPIVQLEGTRRDLRGHLRRLEEASIQTCLDLGLNAIRDERNTGAWLPMPEGPPRKVTSVGIACKRWVTWHGLALNVDIDLSLFNRINPCGFATNIMTRLADHLSSCPTVENLYDPLAAHLLNALELPRDTDDHALQTWASTFVHSAGDPT